MNVNDEDCLCFCFVLCVLIVVVFFFNKLSKQPEMQLFTFILKSCFTDYCTKFYQI